METVISVKNISKSYRLYNTPSEKLKEILHPFGKKYHREFRALHDISLEIKKGEGIGIIGRNGCGKSTLLKVICGVLQPTSGEVLVNGRVSALLELGAGFNPDYTGRQNVYMNGALRGLSKEEMDERFGAIIEFAGIGDFLDQPVKTYSSGMYLRLAFSCAVNVDPDILIVDEALAVGDLNFQAKCLKKMKEIQNNGATFILVSHSLSALANWCSRGLHLHQGKIYGQGNMQDVIHGYKRHEDDLNVRSVAKEADVEKNEYIVIREVICRPADGHDAITPGSPVTISCVFETLIDFEKVNVTLTVYGEGNSLVARLQSHKDGHSFRCPKGRHRVSIDIDRWSFVPDKYKLQFRIASLEDAKPVITDSEAAFLDVAGDFIPGVVSLDRKWHCNIQV